MPESAVIQNDFPFVAAPSLGPQRFADASWVPVTRLSLMVLTLAGVCGFPLASGMHGLRFHISGSGNCLIHERNDTSQAL